MMFFQLFLLGLIFSCCQTGHAKEPCPTTRFFIDTHEFKILGTTDGRAALTQNDLFLERLTPLNRALRMKTPREVQKEEFTNFLHKQVLCWEGYEREDLINWARRLHKNLNQLQIKLPPLSLEFVKTTGEEEGEAHHTRRSLMVVPNGAISFGTFAHEFFHIVTRSFPNLRLKLYKLIHFYPTHKNFKLPQALQNKVVVNPDTPLQSFYIELKESTGRSMRVTPFPFFNSSLQQIQSTPNGFFDFIDLNFVNLHTLQFEDIYKTNFFDLVGKNTNYIIHPEEILADNFKLLMLQKENFPDQDLIENLKLKLQAWSSSF